jgi:hypothetical protein
MLLREVVGGADAMPAATDDHRVISGFRRGLPPEGFPPLMAAKGVTEQREAGKAFHGSDPALKLADQEASIWPCHAITKKPPDLNEPDGSASLEGGRPLGGPP